MAIASSSQAPTLLCPPPFPAASNVDRPTQKQLRSMYLSLQRGQLKTSTEVALATAKALRRVISGARYTRMEELNNTVRLTGVWLQEARKGEQAITNITLRTLHLLAEESGALLETAGGASNGPSRSFSALSTAPGTPAPSSGPSSSFLAPAGGAANLGLTSSPLASPPAASSTAQRPPIRPGLLGNRMDSNFFGHDSTFSISDLVAAGQNANTAASTSNLDSGFPSGASTPGRGFSGSESRDLGMTASETIAEALNEDASQSDVAEEVEEGSEDDETDESEDEESEEASEDMTSSINSLNRPAAARSANAFHLKPLLIQAVQELIDELESTRTNIARDARDHIHSGEIVLTLGHSRTVEAFLKQAARDRHFTVIVADSGTSTAASSYASALPKKNIKILSIPHSSIFTVLPRVTKVILSAHAVLANGALLAPPGAAAAGMAAKVHSTPVLVLAGLHKVCGDWKWVGLASGGAGVGAGVPAPSIAAATAAGFKADTPTMPTKATPAAETTSASNGSSSRRQASAPLAGDTWTRSPQSILSSLQSGTASIEALNEVILHEWDYVEPHLVDVIITNTGEYPGSYVYRLIAENFAQ